MYSFYVVLYFLSYFFSGFLNAMTPTGNKLLGLVLLVFTCGTNGHVRLDFPEARSLSLDFLDSVRTPPPCGMPKGESKTSFEAGTSFNATWHLGYPHGGNFEL